MTTMRDWFASQLAAGLPAFAGSRLAGTLVVKQELVNQLIENWLAGESATSDGPRVDLRTVRVAIKSASVRATEGKISIDLEIGL